MARQIVILETRKGGDGLIVVSGFNWFPIAATANRVPLTGFVSAGVVLDAAHALTTQEQADLDSGTVREERFSLSYAGTSTVAQIQTDLAKRWTDRKAAIDTEPAARQFFGRSFDGTSWTA